MVDLRSRPQKMKQVFCLNAKRKRRKSFYDYYYIRETTCDKKKIKEETDFAGKFWIVKLEKYFFENIKPTDQLHTSMVKQIDCSTLLSFSRTNPKIEFT